MIRVIIFLVVMFACDIGAMKKDRLSAGTPESKSLLRSSASDIITSPINEKKNVSSRRILGRTASADSDNTSSSDAGSKSTLSDSKRKFSRSDDTTASSSTTSQTSASSVSLSQITSNQVPSRSSSKSPRKTSLIKSSKGIKKLLDSDDDEYQKTGYELCAAIKKNNFPRVLDILYFDVNNGVGEEGKTPLITAIEEGHTDIIVELLAYTGIDVNKSDKFGKTPLIVAIEKGRDDIVLKLFEYIAIDVNKGDAFGRTPLITAIQKLIHFKPSSIKALQESDETDKITLTINDATIALVERFLEREDIDLNKADNRKNTPLHHAVLKHSKDVIELLLHDHRINSLLKNVDSRLASQLVDGKSYKDVSPIIRIFFDRGTLDALANDEAFDLHLNEKIIDDNKINQAIEVIQQGVKNNHGQDGDRKLPEKDPLFLKEDFIKKVLVYRLEKSKQPDKIEIVINNSDTTTQEI